jgi:peptide/nickel transport system permease protein
VAAGSAISPIAVGAARRRGGYWAQSSRRLLRDPSGIVGLVLVVVVLAVALLGPVIYDVEPNFESSNGLTLDGDPLGPGDAYPLGTDTSGRDLLARLLNGATVSLLTATLAIVLSALIGIFVGGIAGIAGTVVRETLMRAMDVLLSFPTLLLAMVFLAVARPSVVTVAVIIGLGWGAYLARVVYGITSSLAGRDVTASAIAVGASPMRLLVRHLLPHALPAVVVYVTLGIGVAIQLEAVFGYVGVGLQPPDASWGNMIAEGQGYVVSEPRLVFAPAGAVALAMLGFVLLGDALRNALEPEEPAGHVPEEAPRA